ncbi:MAG: hypothetical protein AAGI45_04690 [Cyanobacteria bacterium P01_H01_bin.26]
MKFQLLALLDSLATMAPGSGLRRLYLLLVAVGSQPRRRGGGWSRSHRLWLWISTGCMAFVGVYGLYVGMVVSTLTQGSLTEAVVGAMASSLMTGLIFNSVYQLLRLLHGYKVMPGLLMASLVRGLAMTLGMIVGIWLGGGGGLAIASLVQMAVLLLVDRRQRQYGQFVAG